MNLKKLFLMLTFFVLLGTTAFAQTTYYVNNSTGLDGYNGLSATVTGAPGVGPKLTIANAIAAAVNGDVISVATTGTAYGAVATGAKTLTFTSTAGTPVVASITIGAATTFTGPFNMAGAGTLTLTTGAVTGAGNITIATGGTISRAAGTLDVEPVFAGTANIAYTAALTIGPEFPASTTVVNNLTTGAGTVVFNASKQINGTLNTGGILTLAGNTLTLRNNTGALVTHTNAGDITATGLGGLSVDMANAGANVTFNPGVGILPNVTVAGAGRTFIVNGPASINGTVTVNSGTVTLTTPTGASGITGSLINNGTGTVTVVAAMTIGGNVSNTSTGVIDFGAANFTITGNVSNSGAQSNTSATTQIANAGNINFDAGIITVNGTVTNTASFSGSSSGTGAATGGFANCGNITFASTTQLVTLTGLVTNSASSSFTASAAANAAMFSGNGRITFASTTGNVVLTGGLTNSTTGFADFGTTPTAPTVGNGSIAFTARTTATIATGTVTNSSTATGATTGTLAAMASGSGDIEFGFVNDTDGAITVTGSVSLEGGAGSGDINFGGGALTVTGSVSNSRSNTAAIIRQRGLLTGTSNVSLGALSQTGTGQIQFAGTTATLTSTGVTLSAGTIASNSTTGLTTVNGNFTQTGGAFTVAASTTGAIGITGNLSISAGTFNHGNTGNTTGNITVSGDLSFTGGTLLLGTGARNFTVTGASSTISAGVAFTNGAATTLVFNRAISAQSLTSGIGVQWPGHLNINNTFPVAPTFNLLVANFGVTGNAIFTAGGAANGVNLNNFTLFVGGDFTNNSGYTGGSNGFVSLNGGGAQTVAGSAAFYNIEVDKAAGVATFSDGGVGIVTYTITGTFNLTNSAVAVGAGPDVIAFNNATTAPTIVRNAGSFAGAPTFTSDVNVVYIGASKTFSNEVPLGGSNKLVNMTIATTGASTVTANIDFEFKGTLTINTGQTFAIGTQIVTSNGAAINVNGTGTWTATTGYLNLNRAAGTVVTTTTLLPEVRVAAGSSGNTLSGTGIGIGTNQDLTLANGTAAVTLTFTGNGPHVRDITTANANNTVTLGSNVVMSRNLVHGNGTIALSTFNLSVAGPAPSMGAATAAITGTGTLIFNTVGAATFTVTGAPTIAANVQLNLDLLASTFTLAGSALTVTGNLTLTRGTLVPTTGINVNGTTLTLASSASTAVTGAGVVTFASPTTLTVNLSGATTFNNLTINGNVTLAGTAGALTITNVLTHTTGLIDFASRDLIVGTLTRAAGTYAATTGYLQVTTALTQGTGFSIPNLRINGGLTVGSTANFTVTDNLYLNGVTLNHTAGASPRLTLGVASGTVPTITIVGAGNLNVAPTFGQGTANYVFTGATTPIVVDATSVYWPASPTTIGASMTVNMTNDGDIVRFDEGRTVNTTSSLNLTKGTLTLNTGNLTLASGMTINKIAPFTLNQTGTTGRISGSAVNLFYTGAQTVGFEYTGALISSINNVTNVDAVGGGLLTIGTAKTIGGNLAANESITLTANTTVTGSISVATGKTLTVTGAAVVLTVNGSTGNILGTLAGTGSVNFTAPAVTLGGFTLTGSVGFVGATGQTVTVPSGGATMTNLNVNLTGLKPILNVAGGNLTVTGGTLTFTNGIIDMGTNTLILDRPSVATNSGLGFSRTAVTGTNVGHVVGKISRQANSGDGGAGTNGRFEFPVGTLSGEYRPAAINFTPSYVVGNPVRIEVSHVNSTPEGTKDLPLDGGNGVKIGNYAPFYWLVNTTPSNLTVTQNFDIEMQANNIGVPYTSDQQLRIIRRQDGSATTNGWAMQGTAANYANYQVVTGSDTTVVARTTSSQGGLVVQGSRFAIGVPTRAPSFTAPTATTFTIAEGATSTIDFDADPQDIGETISSYILVSGPSWAAINATTGLVTLTPDFTVGSTTPYTLTVRATDNGGATADLTVSITVTNINRDPSFTGTGTSTVATGSVKSGETFPWTYAATDADGDVINYSAAVTPTPTGTYSISTLLGTFTFSPVFADAGNTYTFTITATDGSATATTTTAITVNYPVNLGDVDASGSVTSADASLILQYVVGLVTFDAQELWAANVNGDAQVGALDAAWVLFYAVEGTWPTSKIAAAAGTMEMGKAYAGDAGVIYLPVSLKNTSGALSLYTELTIDENAAEVVSVTKATPDGWFVAHNYSNSTLKIAMAGLNSLVDNNVVVIGLKLKDKESSLNITGNAQLNDELAFGLLAKVREIPADFAISQNYPNPFNPTTTIKYAIAQDVPVTVTVYNMLGQKVKTLVDIQQEAGYYTINWNGTNEFGGKVASGIYIYRLTAGKFTSTLKMNLLK